MYKHRELSWRQGRSRVGGGSPDPVPGLWVDRHRFNGGWLQQGPGEEELRAHLVKQGQEIGFGFPEGVSEVPLKGPAFPPKIKNKS